MGEESSLTFACLPTINVDEFGILWASSTLVGTSILTIRANLVAFDAFARDQFKTS